MAAMLAARPARVLRVRAAVTAVALAVTLVLAGLAAFPVSVLAATPERAAAAYAASSDVAVGATATFWATNWATGYYEQVEASVAYVGAACVIYVESGYPVPQVTVERLGTEFDSTVYPTLTADLGAEPNPGIDGDSRVALLLYDFFDSSISGYFSPIDVDPPAGETYSNRRELIYLNAEAVAAEPDNAGSVAAHEFTHLIVYYRDYMLDPSAGREDEPAWVTEGICMYGEHISGYDGRTNSLLRSFANDPSTNLTSWRDYRAHYGASYAFVSYLAVREGQDFIADLVEYPADGVAGINYVLRARGAFETFDTLLDDWVVANFLDGRAPEVSPYSYPDIDVAATPLTVDGPFPLAGSQYVTNFGAVYLDFPPIETGSTFRAVVDGNSTTPLRAALISWDSAGLLPPSVTRLQMTAGDGSATAPAGYDRHTLAVWARGTVGQEALYDFRYSASTGTWGGPEFVDLGSDDPYYPYVAALFARNVISGKEIPPGSGLWYFLGKENVLRAQFAKMIMEAIGLHTLAIDHLDDPTFSDVRLTYDQSGAPEAYPYDYVEEAASLGIVNGFDAGDFRPYSAITRGQLVLMIVRGAKAVGKPLPAYTGRAQPFADVIPSNPIYRDVMTAYSAGIFSGSVGKDGRLYFYPYSSASRNHVAKMTANLVGFLEAGSLEE
jgi:hypothetical protein